ncbi:cupin domain-containing protein [Crocosphaera sp. UHCC 0190]|uniref:cupin domain-containing protein n=1 Tax=Crocosphaera sp. UHCC 0190 TaxID=3110246 RepID=UPI002B213C0B|nr:cupin domain-containing protein [Crocosphaera sp. UHCC 0190]MEA5510488.1 cupin domain-containing protein [Crocosphaera sp. UHCC 0190]
MSNQATTAIKIEHQPSEARLEELGVKGWPTWSKEVSIFPWTYDESETCYFLEGDVIVTPDGEQPVSMGKGDLVTFPAGMSCTWHIRGDVRKHYKFG